MAYTSEIEKLERRWAENPKGRNFAPLADAYRKAGELDRAIELCHNGLELHPDYVSAHIVLGRCLVDMKNDPGAEGVFRKVLDLDPENILALRMLAELTERNERYDEAVKWIDRLIAADPMNGDAAESSVRVKGKAAQAAAKSTLPMESVPALHQPPAPASPSAEPAPIVSGSAVEPEPIVLGSAAEPPPAPAAEPPPAAPEPVSAASDVVEVEHVEIAEQPTTAMGMPDFQLERASGGHPSPELASPSPELEVFDGAIDFGTVAESTPATEGLQLEEPVLPTAPDAETQLEGLARTQYEGSGLFRVDQSAMPPEGALPEAAPEAPPAPAEPAETLMVDAEFDLEPPANPMADLPLIMPEDVEAPTPPQRISGRQTPAPMERRVSAPLSSPPVPAAVQLSDDDGAADAAALSQAEPVLTETMAELYLHQGHREDARRVYEALLAARPGDPRLQAKLNELSGVVRTPAPAQSGQKVADFLRGILRAKPGSAAPVLGAPDGTTLDQVFAQVPEEESAAVEPAATTPASTLGSPTRMASDAISLDSVFGEETGSHPVSAPAANAAPPAAAKPAGGFSFDEFFSPPASPAESEPPPSPSTASAGAAPRTSAPGTSQRPSARTPRAQEDERDLDHFQEWLKGLKA